MNKIARRKFVVTAALLPLAFTPMGLAQTTGDADASQGAAPGAGKPPVDSDDFVIAGAEDNSLVAACGLQSWHLG